MIGQSLTTADIQQCFGSKSVGGCKNRLVFQRSFSLSAIANVQVDLFFAKDPAVGGACQTSAERSPLFGGKPPCWSTANATITIPEIPEDDDDVFAEMVSGSEHAEHLAATVLEHHLNCFFQWVVIPVLVIVCLLYAFINAPAPAKGQIYRSLAATFCLLVGFGLQCCFVSLFAPDVP